MISKKYSLSQKGFTLVELLIVIVIIGILAGVVIGVLNPIQQQNRARDAGIRAQLDKIALSNKSLYASSPRSTNRSPTDAEFLGGIANAAAGSNCTATDATAADANPCLVTLTGVGLPSTCAANGYTGAAAAQCQYAYIRGLNNFIVAAKGWATPAQIFMFSCTENAATGNVTEGFYVCPTTWVIADGTTGCTQTNL